MSTYCELQGEIIANFKLLRLLGTGGTGAVYLARQLNFERVAACKILNPEMAENPVYIRNFIREARMAARLEHPNIIQALDVGSGSGFHYFAMEYVPGVSLEKIRVSNPDKITVTFLLNTVICLADALDYAWQNFHIYHGDIKPDNLMIREQDNVLKLADLGLARVAGSDDPDSDVMATPLYAAPEIIMGDLAHADVRSDIYSSGIMLYELLAGFAPFRGRMDDVLRSHLDETPQPLAEVNPGLDRELACFVDRMIAKAPVDRPGSWAEVREFFRSCLARDCGRVNLKKADLKNLAGHKCSESDFSAEKIVPWILCGILFLLACIAGYIFFMTLF